MAGQDLGTENDLNRELKESIECLKRLVTEGLARLHGNLDILQSEFKSDIKEMSRTIKDLEKSLNFTQDEVDTFKEQLKKETEEHPSEMELLTAKITILEQSLKEEAEQNITLEQYTSRENLRLNNIQCKGTWRWRLQKGYLWHHWKRPWFRYLPIKISRISPNR